MINSINRITLTDGSRRKLKAVRTAVEGERSSCRRSPARRKAALAASGAFETQAVERVLCDLGKEQKHLVARKAPGVVADMRDLLVCWLKVTLGLVVEAEIITAETAPYFFELLENCQASKLQHLAGQEVITCQQRSAYLRRIRKLREVISRQFPASCLVPRIDFENLGSTAPVGRIREFTSPGKACDWLRSLAAEQGIRNLSITAANCSTYARLLYVCAFARAAALGGWQSRNLRLNLSELLYQLKQALQVITTR